MNPTEEHDSAINPKTEPLQPAGPVPGSVGSGKAQFQPGYTPPAKTNKTSKTKYLIAALGGLVIIVIVALVVIFVVANSQPATTKPAESQNSSTTSTTPEPVAHSLVCTKSIKTTEELTDYPGATESTHTLIASYENQALLNISLKQEIRFASDEAAIAVLPTIETNYKNRIKELTGNLDDPFESTFAERNGTVTVGHFANADVLTATNAPIFNLAVDEDGDISDDYDLVEDTYESLRYICELK